MRRAATLLLLAAAVSRCGSGDVASAPPISPVSGARPPRPHYDWLGVVGTGQFLEGYVVSPKLVGESIGLHPVWLIFALFAFGDLFGFTGLLIAVPTAAAIGVIVRHLIRSYQRSPLFRGRRPAVGGP